MRALSVLTLSACLTAWAFAAAPPARTPAQWMRWVEDLGDEGRRDAATKKLDALGEDVLPLLHRAERGHADPDVRLRAALLASGIRRRVFGELRCFRGHTEAVVTFDLSPDGKSMVSAAGNLGKDHEPRVWDVESGKELFRLGGHAKAVYAVAWSADGAAIVTGGLDGRLIVHDAKSGRATKAIACPERVSSLALTPDAKRAVCCGETRVVRVWDLHSGKQIAANEDAGQGVNGVAVLPGGKHAVTASYDSNVRLIEVETGKLLREMDGGHGHDRAAWFVTASADGAQVVSTGSACAALLWDVKTGKKLRAFVGHSENVPGAAFSRDGKRLITAGYDKVARVWDVRTGKQRQCLEGHDGRVTRVQFLPDGKRAVTASYDGTLRLWRVRE